MERTEITAGYHGEIQGDDNEALQKAVDLVHEKGGGKVLITSGSYLMHHSLSIPSNVHVIGQGAVELLKCNVIKDEIDGYLGFHHTDLFVKNPEKFRKGLEVYITDDRSCCFYDTVATIVGIEGNRLLLDSPLHHDYGEQYNGVVHTSFPVVSFVKSQNSSISNVSIKGNSGNNIHCGGCRTGAIYMLLSRSISVSEMNIEDYNGEGISFQQCVDITIVNNNISGNKGSGIHPGSGSVMSLIERNNITGNKEDGIYYCLRVSHSTASKNMIACNGKNGISIGHRDIRLEIIGNVLEKNSNHGIYFRNEKFCGDDSIIKDNVMNDNDLFFHTQPVDLTISHNEGIDMNIISSGERNAGYRRNDTDADVRHLLFRLEKEHED